jgi:hypothetical protein
LNKEKMRKINEEINCTAYAIRTVKGMSNEIADISTRIDFASNMVEEGLLDVELYKNYVVRQKKEIKNMIAQIYSYLRLEEVKGSFDEVFKDEK